MRVKDEPNFQPDWTSWLKEHETQHDDYRGKSKADEFDPAYDGYWLRRWE